MKKINIIFIFLIPIAIYLGLDFRPSQKLEVNFLDIGQGDAIYIRTPQGHNIVIDGGPDNVFLHELSQVMPWWDREIDYLIISHFHADHMMGFIELLNKYKVKNVLVTAHEPNDFLYEIWIDKLSKENINIDIAMIGDEYIISDKLYWKIILADSGHEDYNENSLVMKLSYKDNSFLFMGDLGVEGEKNILASGLDITSKYLKVGHHGSKYSSSIDFLRAVNPEFCIVQSGKDNKFNHPHPETIDRLESIDCEIMDTQLLGRISLEID